MHRDRSWGGGLPPLLIARWKLASQKARRGTFLRGFRLPCDDETRHPGSVCRTVCHEMFGGLVRRAGRQLLGACGVEPFKARSPDARRRGVLPLLPPPIPKSTARYHSALKSRPRATPPYFSSSFSSSSSSSLSFENLSVFPSFPTPLRPLSLYIFLSLSRQPLTTSGRVSSGSLSKRPDPIRWQHVYAMLALRC